MKHLALSFLLVIVCSFHSKLNSQDVAKASHSVANDTFVSFSIDTLLKLAHDYTYHNLDSALWYANKALVRIKHYKKEDRKDKLIDGLWRKGMIYHGMNLVDSSQAYYQLASSLAENYSRSIYLQIKLNHFGLQVQQRTLDLIPSLEYFESGLDTTQQSEREIYYWTKYFIARAYENEGDFNKAAEVLIPLLDFPNKDIRDKHRGGNLKSIGRCYQRLKMYQLARQYYEQALQYEEKNTFDWQDILLDLAHINVALADYHNAQQLLQSLDYKSLAVYDKINYLMVAIDLAVHGHPLDQEKVGLSELDQLLGTVDDDYLTVKALSKKAQYLQHNNAFNQSKDVINTIKSICSSLEFIELEDEINLLQLELNQWAFSNYDVAFYDAFRSYILKRDQIEREIAENSVNEQKILYDTEKRLLENQKLKSEQLLQESIIDHQRTYIWSGTIALMTIVILSVFLFIQYNKLKKLNIQISEKNDQVLTLNRELNHRVKNNLAFMTSLMEMQARRVEHPEASQVIMQGQTRLKSLSLMYDILNKEKQAEEISLKTYIDDLMGHLKSIYSTTERPIVISTAVEVKTWNAQDATKIGLIINELVTNTVKYQSSKPSLSINIALKSESLEVLEITYHDGSIVDESNDLKISDKGAMGHLLIKLLLDQMNGRVTLKMV